MCVTITSLKFHYQTTSMFIFPCFILDPHVLLLFKSAKLAVTQCAVVCGHYKFNKTLFMKGHF